METTFEERLTEYWAHTYQDNPKMMDVVEDESFDAQAIMQEWAQEAEQQTSALTPADSETDITEVNDWEDVNGN